MKAGGAPPPVAKRDRLSSVGHGSRIAAIGENRARHLLSRRRASEGTARGSAKTKPLPTPILRPSRIALCLNEIAKTNPFLRQFFVRLGRQLALAEPRKQTHSYPSIWTNQLDWKAMKAQKQTQITQTNPAFFRIEPSALIQFGAQ